MFARDQEIFGHDADGVAKFREHFEAAAGNLQFRSTG